MGNFTTAFLFVMALNLVMVLTQLGIDNVNPASEGLGTMDGSLLGDPRSGYYNLNESDPFGSLPTSRAAVDEDNGNFFSDVMSSITGWFSNSLGLKYLKQIVSAPYRFFQAIHLPPELAYTLGAFWYVTTIFIAVMFVWGRE